MLTFATDVTEARAKSIPRWLAASPEFAAALRSLWRPPERSDCPFRLLSKYKATLFKAAVVTRKTKLAEGSHLLNYSHHVNLLRLIAARNQDLPRIERLMGFAPALGTLVEFRDGRYVDQGLEEATRDVLLSGAPTEPPARPNNLRIVKDALPCSRAGVPHLRTNVDDAPAFDVPGKTAVAEAFWSRVWALE